MSYDSIIIGAGATGLYAASKLTAAGKRVLLLEARNRVGGRIYTITDARFTRPIEAGAEFVHGDVPITLSLLKEAKISFHEMTGEIFQIENGSLKESDLFDRDWPRIIDQLHQLKTDIPFEEFLQRYFPGNHQLHENIIRFVEGYNAADSSKVSSFALKEEWSAEEEPIQNRPDNGYGPLMEHLLNAALKSHLVLRLNEEVIGIDWSSEQIHVKSSKGVYTASKVLITVPLGVLQSEKIEFTPSIPKYIGAAQQIGFGPVVKVVAELKKNFWEKYVLGKFPSFKFLFSDADVPTWWSQRPSNARIITGWLGGPKVHLFEKRNFHALALKSLSYLMDVGQNEMETNIEAIYIHDWLNDPFSLGAYSYDILQSKDAKKILNEPISHKIYFAGEGCYSGAHTGTVEAAFQSAEDAVKRMLHS
jgi:monoamine oxidase